MASSSSEDQNVVQTSGPSTSNYQDASQNHNVAAPDELAFLPNDPASPRNWPEWRKWSIVGVITLIDLSVSWGASGYSPAEKQMEKIFGVSAEVGTL
jgi:hypothetical protein